jgi:hypothetical protein
VPALQSVIPGMLRGQLTLVSQALSAELVTETFVSRGPALRKPRKSMNSFIPRPVLADTWSTCIPGRTAWMLASAVGSSNSTACDRSILVSNATSALLKIVGYLIL